MAPGAQPEAVRGDPNHRAVVGEQVASVEQGRAADPACGFLGGTAGKDVAPIVRGACPPYVARFPVARVQVVWSGLGELPFSDNDPYAAAAASTEKRFQRPQKCQR